MPNTLALHCILKSMTLLEAKFIKKTTTTVKKEINDSIVGFLHRHDSL